MKYSIKEEDKVAWQMGEQLNGPVSRELRWLLSFELREQFLNQSNRQMLRQLINKIDTSSL
jgi:hypothetical protein